MAYKLIWSPAARDDLHDIVIFIARDNPNRAMSFGYELFPRLIDCKNFQRWAASCLSTGMIAFARSSFAPSRFTNAVQPVSRTRSICVDSGSLITKQAY
jgi:hypothetical protein